MNLPPDIQLEASGTQLTFTVTGVLLADDVIRVTREHYPAFRGRRILWDLTAADVSRAASDDFARVAIAVRDHIPVGVERKTAYVVAGQMASVAVWKYLNEVIRIHVPVEYQVFADVDAAQRWLDRP